MIFTGYNPYKQSKPDPAEDVPQATFEAAQAVHASHLSKDGLTAYCERFGYWFEAEWDGVKFGAWWSIPALPRDAVKVE